MDIEVIEEEDAFVNITISGVLPIDINEKEDLDLSDAQSVLEEEIVGK